MPIYQGHACMSAETRASAEVGLTANIGGAADYRSRVNVTSPTALLVNELTRNNCNTPTQLVNTTEQQHSRRNLLRCTRYAEMSTERKTIMLTHQQARRAEAKKIQLSQQAKDTYAAPEVNTHVAILI